MTKRILLSVGMLTLIAVSAQAQAAPPAPSPTSPSVTVDDSAPQSPRADGLSPAELSGNKVGLVRGIVKRTDAVHDLLVVRAFGGRDIRIAFDPRTQLLPENTQMRLTSIPAGSIVSVDTVIDNGKLFARAVRTGPSGSTAVELNGRVVRFDAGKSRLIMRDPISPENVSLRVTPSTAVVSQGRAASAQSLTDGMLVRVRLSTDPDTASNIEILAKRGDSFVFQGRILSLDLRSRMVALSNDTDKSVRELAVSSLDAGSLDLLREGADVNIEAEFDGDRYNVRSVTLVPQGR